jgi:hypothetical protein
LNLAPEVPTASRLVPQEGVSERTELGAEAAVEDDAAYDCDRTADQLGIDAQLDLDFVPRTRRECLAQALELTVCQRAGRDDLRLYATSRFVGEPFELVADASEVDETPLIDEERQEVANGAARARTFADRSQHRASLRYRMQRPEESVLEIRARLEESCDLQELAPHPVVVALFSSE